MYDSDRKDEGLDFGQASRSWGVFMQGKKSKKKISDDRGERVGGCTKLG
jgi:hypothetical protein